MRPKTLDDIYGQADILGENKILRRAIEADQIQSLILYGPPGTGKTSISSVIAENTDSDFKVLNAVTSGVGDIREIIKEAKEKKDLYNTRTILFIDEIHRLNMMVEEVLYPALEDYCLDIIIGKGPSARSVRLDLNSFTMVGATTRAGLISSPLRDRFGVINRLEFYNNQELTRIVKRSARILNIDIHKNGAKEIAMRSRGTPRISNRLLKRVRDFAEVKAEGIISAEVVNDALKLLEIDEKGLDSIDHKLLRVIIEKFDGGPVGLNTLAAAISEETETIEDVYEPYLLQMGFIQRTPRGRVATSSAYSHLDIENKSKKGDLFDSNE